MVSTGTSDAISKTQQILSEPTAEFLCIDVANGYSEHFVQFVAKAREAAAKLSSPGTWSPVKCAKS